MRKLIYGILVIGLLAICMGNRGCTAEDEQYYKEQDHTVQNQKKLTDRQPPVSLDWSLERDNINKRTKLWNDPNKVSYFYPISMGRIMGFYVVKGKISSVNSQVTNTMQVSTAHGASVAIPSPAEDGSYGSNGEGIFGWTTDGTYFEWHGDYFFVDKPLRLSQPVEQLRTVQ